MWTYPLKSHHRKVGYVDISLINETVTFILMAQVIQRAGVCGGGWFYVPYVYFAQYYRLPDGISIYMAELVYCGHYGRWKSVGRRKLLCALIHCLP